MKKYKIKLSSPDMNYYYSSDEILSDEDKARKQRIENELCNLINITETGLRNANASVILKKREDHVEVVICGDNIEIEEVSE